MFNNLSTLQKFLLTIVIVVLVYIGATAASYAAFSSILPNLANKTSLLPSKLTDNKNTPQYEVCVLNGKLYSKEAKAEWDKHRPLGVMIENSTDARPQSGLSSADIVYEAVAEGGITRFMGMFYCNTDEYKIAPVRSARTYFLDWFSEYNGVYIHAGGANTPGPANALGQIVDYKVKSLNGIGNVGFPTFQRDQYRTGRYVAIEHSMFTNSKLLWTKAEDWGWKYADTSGVNWNAQFVPWKFKDSAQISDQVASIDVSFWGQTGYLVNWKYDSVCNCYKRTNGGQPHTDLNTKEQLGPTNVVVQFMKESRANDGYPGNVHLLYQTTGTGRALFFIDGKVVEGKWSKTNRTARTKYTDNTGKEIEFNRGQIWIQTVPLDSDVDYVIKPAA